MKLILFFLIAIYSVHGTDYDKCGLKNILQQNGFPSDQLPNWVCLIISESDGKTDAKGGPNDDGSYDFGLFQINSRYWCAIGYPGNGCNVDCNNLLNDDISDDSKCAQYIFSQSGFGAWNGWKSKCQGNLPDLSDC